MTGRNTFPHKLWAIAHSPDPCVQWTECGTRVAVDFEAVQSSLLGGPSPFKTRNLASFVRNLNLYGFRMLNRLSRGRGRKVYHHPHFVRGRERWVDRIGRNGADLLYEDCKTNQQSQATAVSTETVNEQDDLNRRYPKRNRRKRVLSAFDVEFTEDTRSSASCKARRKRSKPSFTKEETCVNEPPFENRRRTKPERNDSIQTWTDDAEDAQNSDLEETGENVTSQKRNQRLQRLKRRSSVESLIPEHSEILEDMPLAFRTRHKAQELAHILAPDNPKPQVEESPEAVCIKRENVSPGMEHVRAPQFGNHSWIRGRRKEAPRDILNPTGIGTLLIKKDEDFEFKNRAQGSTGLFHYSPMQMASVAPKSELDNAWTWVSAFEKYDAELPPSFDVTSDFGEEEFFLQTQEEAPTVKSSKSLIDEVRNQLFRTLEQMERKDLCRKRLAESNARRLGSDPSLLADHATRCRNRSQETAYLEKNKNINYTTLEVVPDWRLNLSQQQAEDRRKQCLDPNIIWVDVLSINDN